MEHKAKLCDAPGGGGTESASGPAIGRKSAPADASHNYHLCFDRQARRVTTGVFEGWRGTCPPVQAVPVRALSPEGAERTERRS